MRLSRTLTVLVGVLALALAACGSDDTAGPAADSSPATSTATGTDPTAPAAAASPTDLGGDLAATVGDTDISAEEVTTRADAVIEQAQASETGTATDPEAQRPALEAQILSEMIVGQLILDGADELGVEPTDEDIDQVRAETVAQVGGEEAFEEQIAAAGYDDVQLQRELRILATFQAVTEELAATGTQTPAGGESPGAAPEGQQDQPAVQQWLLEQVQAADVTVDDDFGVWDPASGQVVPTSA